MESSIRLEKLSGKKTCFWEARIHNNDIEYEWGQVGGNSQILCQTILVGKNIGRANETTPSEQADGEARTKANKKIDSGYKLISSTGSFSSGLNDERTSIKPMLAYAFEDTKSLDRVNVFYQPKFDGIRCIADCETGELFSRQGKKIACLPHINKDILGLLKNSARKFRFLDGELYSHDMTFQGISSIVSKSVNFDAKNAKKIQYVIYDIVDPDKTFGERWNHLCSIVGSSDLEQKFKESSLIKSPTIGPQSFKDVDAELQHDSYAGNGYEGMMIRRDNCGYETKRTHQLVKYKKFLQEEYTIVGIDREELAETAGAIRLALGCNTSVTFSARPAMTEEERQHIWDNQEEFVGKIATIKFQELTDDGIPRFPVCLGIRDMELG